MGHNPTGGVLPMERRKELYRICQAFDVIIIEDDPYWYLQYPSAATSEAKSRGLPEPEPAVANQGKSSGYEFIDSLVPSFLSIDVDGRVVRLDTFSKTVAPGCRLGWITAQPAFIERYARYVSPSPTPTPTFPLPILNTSKSGTNNPPASPRLPPSSPPASSKA